MVMLDDLSMTSRLSTFFFSFPSFSQSPALELDKFLEDVR